MVHASEILNHSHAKTCLKKLEKASTISKDQSKDGQDAVQSVTDKYIKEVDNIVSKKEAEISTV